MSNRFSASARSYAPASTPEFIKKDLDAELQEFSSTISSSSTVSISDVKPVASYSWIEAPTRTIAVPGAPGIWKGNNPTRVPQDAGLVFIDQNSHRMGAKTSPLTPIFVAIENLGGYDFKGLDLISDRNNLRKLLRWATGSSDAADFRIDLDLAGQTCLFTRREALDSERVTGFKGYGHEYEKAATKNPPGCEKATGHHRIISIGFGKLKILLRFEVDAHVQARPGVDDLASAFSGLGVDASTTTTAAPSTIMDITVIQTSPRTLVPQSSLIEMKTRASHKALDWEEVYPQLYLSQTAYLYLAKHNRGTFMPAEKHELGSVGMKPHADRAQKGMGKLEAVLIAILASVKKHGKEGGLSLVCVGGKLALYKRKAGTGKTIDKKILEKFL